MHLFTSWLIVTVTTWVCVYGQLTRYNRPIPAPVRPSGGGQVIAILKQTQDSNPDGSYQYSFESENGIAVQEQGYQKPGTPEPVQEVQGSFQYTAPDGTPISLQYISNEGGFQPQGSHLPVPPPIPPAIQRALDWNAAHPEPEDQRRYN